jgi:hypothetical protein
MQRKFVHSFHVPGSLGADMNIRFTVPSDCSLVHSSAVSSNDSDATITLGTSADTNGFLAACVIGDSAVPVEKGIADFDGALLSDAGNEPPRLQDGDIFVIVLDFDGGSGTAADDFTLVLTFVEG